jgi:predicted CXXCH cytochrome family protein
MEVLLRERRRLGTAIEYQDREITARLVTIGSAPDQTIQLLGADVAPRHFVLSSKGGRIELDCASRRLRVSVNGKPVHSAKLVEGDRIELAGHELEVIAAPAGFDLGVQVSPNEAVKSSAFEAAFQTRLSQAFLGKRSLSWLLFVVVVVGGLAAPLYERGHRATEEAQRIAWPVSDGLWSTGPLLPAHELTIGSDCSVCHVTLFQRVQDAQCKACHGDVLDHVGEPVQAAVGVDRCATCHKEHNDPQFFVVRRDGLCSGCHASNDAFPASVDLQTVAGFASTTHPPFDVHLLVPRTEPIGNLLSFEWDHQLESLENAKEQSNLKFPHDVHLDASKVQSPVDSSSLDCGDCHVLSSDGEHFLPVQMESHCRSCHDLQFDPADPTRELPHGQPTEVIFALEGHYLRKFGDPTAAAQGAPRRRLPDDPREAACTGRPFDCAMRATIEEVANQFSRRGCVTCHVVEDNRSDDIYQRFQVHPVRLQTDYYPAAGFPHDQHLTQGDAVGPDACSTCHGARTSTSSVELLIPGIDNCLECHGDRPVRDRVALNCVSCHSYHPRAPRDVLSSPRP